jgi:hypothetical protein
MQLWTIVKPNEEYDSHGIFRGCFTPLMGKLFKGGLPITSLLLLSYLLHWSTPSQPRNAAGVAVALNDSHMETCLTLLL